MTSPTTTTSPDLARALAAQGLTAEDIEANRAGRASPAQLERLRRVQKWGQITVYGTLGATAGLSVALAAYHYAQHQQATIFILPAIALVFCAAIYLLVYRLNRLPPPSEVARARVTAQRATVGGSIVSSSRGVYNVWLDGVRYSGCATDLSNDVRTKGRVVDAYIVAEHKLVVALVPVE